MKSRIVISILIILACLCPIGALASGCDTLRIRVMTYNLRLGELATLEQLAEHINAFSPDFVALQEVDVHTMRRLAPHQNGKDFIGEIAYHTGMFGFYGKTIPYRGGYEGIAILSKYPAIKVEKIMLPNPQNTEPRALLAGVFEMGEDTISFNGTHLDVVSRETRKIQAEWITEHLSHVPYPTVIAGDFNARHYTEAITDVMNVKWFPATDSAFTFPAKAPFLKLDYIYARPIEKWRLISTQAIQSTLSDHLPIISILEYIK